MSAPTRQEMEAQIAQFLEPWAWETTSYNATVARDDALAKAAQIVEAFPALATPPAPNDDLRAALEWYAERVADCRKITPEGDNARQALDLDGGKRARAALKENRRGRP